MESLVIRSEDFYHQGATGLSLSVQKRESPEPCTGCSNRQQCIAEYLACERYKGYLTAKSYYVDPDTYMSRSGDPSRSIYVGLFGDDGDLPEIVVPETTTRKEEIREAIEAAKNSEYPAEARDSRKARRMVGSYSEWRERKRALLAELRAKLEELQAEA